MIAHYEGKQYKRNWTNFWHWLVIYHFWYWSFITNTFLLLNKSVERSLQRKYWWKLYSLLMICIATFILKLWRKREIKKNTSLMVINNEFVKLVTNAFLMKQNTIYLIFSGYNFPKFETGVKQANSKTSNKSSSCSNKPHVMRIKFHCSVLLFHCVFHFQLVQKTYFHASFL